MPQKQSYYLCDYLYYAIFMNTMLERIHTVQAAS